MDIGPIMASGTVGHVNHHGQAWVMSDVQMKAMEQSVSSNMVSNIVSLDLVDFSNTSMQNRRDCSYMMHDPEDNGEHHRADWRKGQRLNFSLKISTRTNAKDRREIKPVFIQAWNVRVVQ